MTRRPILHGLLLAALSSPLVAAQAQTAVQAPTTTRAALPRADASFLENAAESGHAEVEASRLALEKNPPPAVREFAQMMIDEHQRVSQELATLATSKGVELPDKATLLQRGKIKLLSTADGDNFARRYISSIGVESHEDAVELFQKAAADAQDPDVKAFATRNLPRLQEHLTKARALETTLKPATPSVERRSNTMKTP